MISVISSTNRKDSNSLKIAQAYVELLENQDAEVALLDLSRLPVNVAFSECFGNRSDTFQQEFIDTVEKSEKFVFIIPEYNGGFPGILKVFIDAIPPSSFHFKKAALVGLSSGNAGALRAMDQFGNVLNYLKVDVLSDRPKLSGIEKAISQDGEIHNSHYISRLLSQSERIVLF